MITVTPETIFMALLSLQEFSWFIPCRTVLHSCWSSDYANQSELRVCLRLLSSTPTIN